MSDPAWHDGLTGWVPLKDVLAWSAQSITPPLLPVRNSIHWPGLVVLGLAVFALLFLAVLISLVSNGKSAGSAGGVEFMYETGAIFVFFLISALAGIVVSLVGIFVLRARNHMNIGGFCANAFLILFFVVSLATGVFRKNEIPPSRDRDASQYWLTNLPGGSVAKTNQHS
ncbi:hypothetical protein Cflav_PD4948 [Pedosphaera parvula Ellin514]|uniref:Uncharacterized protein n=2 Tax=Pedosphaera TaxID=1032526 RepID=B9XCW7_PEDPL|nr:hypothetical protein Cflav_PD4948 [Pedosphaera parvula Ellin514]